MSNERETTKMHITIDVVIYEQLMKLAQEENRPLGRQVEVMLKYYLDRGDS